MAEAKTPHVAMIPIPTQGHISPLFHLAAALATKGFVVTFINTEANHDSMVLDKGPGFDIRLETVPGIQGSEVDLSVPEKRYAFVQGVMAMEGPVEELLKEKLPRGEDPPVSCIISDLPLSWPRQIAERIGIPDFKFWSSSASLLVLECSMPAMVEKGDIPAQDRSVEKFIDYVPGLSPLPIWGLPIDYSNSTDDPGFARRYARARNCSTTPCVLLNTYEELEGSAMQALREINVEAIAVGPLSLSSNLASNASLWKEDGGCLEWLNKQERSSVLYLSFGSLATLIFEQVRELLAALEELQQPFLLAFRPNSVPGMKPEFLEHFKERSSSFGLVVSWGPQLDILRHPSIAGFFTHCGWNSVLESISSAVPMLCWPCMAEQHLNCKLVVEDWKIGLKFSNVTSQKMVLKSEFLDVVNRFMRPESGAYLRSNIEKLAVSARGTASSEGSSTKSLERFLRMLTEVKQNPEH